MSKISHFSIIAFLAICTALMVSLLVAQDVDEGYTYEPQDEAQEDGDA